MATASNEVEVSRDSEKIERHRRKMRKAYGLCDQLSARLTDFESDPKQMKKAYRILKKTDKRLAKLKG